MIDFSTWCFIFYLFDKIVLHFNASHLSVINHNFKINVKTLFFLHRKSKAKLRNQYQYPDTQKGDVDAFSREPFVVHFQAPKTGKNKQGKLRC